jgi:hypothetical protein
MNAVNITLRVVIGALGGPEQPSSHAGPLDRYWFNASSVSIPYTALSQSNLTNLSLWVSFSTDNKTWSPWRPYTKINLTGNYSQGEVMFTPGNDGYYRFYTLANNTRNRSEPPPPVPDLSLGIDTHSPSSSMDPLPTYSKRVFQIKSIPSDSLSGVSSLTLYYRGGSGQWDAYSTLVNPPWVWEFKADHDGIYEFYTIAQDLAGNRETAPPTNHTWTYSDGTPPQVIETYPKNGDTGIPPDTIISITFSEKMDIRATEGALISDFTYKKSWNDQMTILSLTPEPLLGDAREYHIEIGSDAIDLSGNPLIPISISFTTARSYHYAWIVGCVRDEKGVPLQGVKVTLSRDGNTINTTITRSGGGYNITIDTTGTYHLRFEKSGYESTTRTISIEVFHKEYENDVVLKPLPSSSTSQVWVYILVSALMILIVVSVIILLLRRRRKNIQTSLSSYYR